MQKTQRSSFKIATCENCQRRKMLLNRRGVLVYNSDTDGRSTYGTYSYWLYESKKRVRKYVSLHAFNHRAFWFDILVINSLTHRRTQVSPLTENSILF